MTAKFTALVNPETKRVDCSAEGVTVTQVANITGIEAVDLLRWFLRAQGAIPASYDATKLTLSPLHPQPDFATALIQGTLNPIKDQITLVYIATRESSDPVARELIETLYKNVVRMSQEAE